MMDHTRSLPALLLLAALLAEFATAAMWRHPPSSNNNNNNNNNNTDTDTGAAKFRSVPPQWPQSWAVKNSLQIYACNYSGWLDADLISKFSLVALDWSTGKELWANEHTMDAEQLMVDQVAKILERRPDTIAFVYRNTVKALSWFGSVREKLADPRYSGYFLK